MTHFLKVDEVVGPEEARKTARVLARPDHSGRRFVEGILSMQNDLLTKFSLRQRRHCEELQYRSRKAATNRDGRDLVVSADFISR